MNGQLLAATWDEAMDLIVAKSRALSESLTNHSIAFYTTGQLFLEEYYALALIGKAGLNTLHMCVPSWPARRLMPHAHTDGFQGWQHATLYCHGCRVYARVLWLRRPARVLR